MNVGFQFIVLDSKQILGGDHEQPIEEFVLLLKNSTPIDGQLSCLETTDRKQTFRGNL